MLRLTVYVLCYLSLQAPALAVLTLSLIPERSDYPIDNSLYSGVVDVYELRATNTGSPATSVELVLLGDFINGLDGNQAFRERAEIPVVGRLEVPDTFFVVLNSATVLATGTIDTATQLSASYTLPGDTPIIPSGVETTLAYLMVEPEGCVTLQSARFAIDGFFEGVTELGGGCFEAMPLPGSTIDFGNTLSGKTLKDAVHFLSSHGTANVLSASLGGEAADLFEIVNFMPASFGEEGVAYDLRFVGADRPGTYSATLQLAVQLHPLDDAQLVEYELLARVPVPEPSTGVYGSLILVGAIGWRMSRGKLFGSKRL